MSFLKITDPKKRDFIVNECFLRQGRTSNKTFYQNVSVTWTHNTDLQSSNVINKFDGNYLNNKPVLNKYLLQINYNK